MPVLLLCVVLAAGAGFWLINSVVMPDYTDLSNKGMVAVPPLEGESFAHAQQKCFNVGLRLNISEAVYSDSLADSLVMRQKPAAGKKVKKGRVLSVVLSKGSEIATIPNVDSLEPGPAKSELRRAGFESIQTEEVHTSKADRGFVVSVEPKAGSQASRETRVVLSVSKGKRPQKVAMPNVIGEPLSAASRQIRRKGLKVGTVSNRVVSGQRAGVVLKQSYRPGEIVPFNRRVDLVVTVTE
ncbi:MAG: PASTA domain-containing protein [Fibrobacterota bacterium]